MFSRICSALKARRAAMLEAEALVYRFGSRGVEMAQTFAHDRSVPEERREHYGRVARIAERRDRGLQGLDMRQVPRDGPLAAPPRIDDPGRPSHRERHC